MKKIATRLGIDGIYYPMKTIQTDDYKEKGIIKKEMTWTNLQFNQIIDNNLFDIPEV